MARYDSHGRYLLTAGTDRTIKLWNANPAGSSGPEPATPIKSYTSGHYHDILALDVAPDNSQFASGGADKNVLIWDVATSSILRRFSAHEGRINDVRYASPLGNDDEVRDPNILVTAGYDAILRFYDLRAQGAWRPIMECKDAKDTIQCVAIRKGLIWTGSVDGVVRCYDIRQGKMTEDVVDEPIISLQPAKSGSFILVSTTCSVHRIFDCSNGTLLQTLRGHKCQSYRCRSALSLPYEDVVISGDETGKLRAWDILSGKDVDVANGTKGVSEHKKTILWTECNPTKEGQVVTAAADGTVKVWNPS